MAHETFANYATSAAFNLTLSQNMIEALTLVRATQHTIPHSLLRLSQSTAKALMHRGLIEIKHTPPAFHGDPAQTWWRLTKPGEHVYLLMTMNRS